MFRNGLRKLGGRRESPTEASLPGGGLGGTVRPMKHRPSKLLTAAVCLALVLLYVFVRRDSTAPSSLTTGETATAPSKVDEVVEKLNLDAKRRRQQGRIPSSLAPTVKPTAEPTQPPVSLPSTTTAVTSVHTPQVSTEEPSTQPTTNTFQEDAGQKTEGHRGTADAANVTSPSTISPRMPTSTATMKEPAPPVTAEIDLVTATSTLVPTHQQETQKAVTQTSPANIATPEENSTAAPVEPATDTPSASPINSVDPRTIRPGMYQVRSRFQVEKGESAPEEPDRLPGLQLSQRTFTAEELLERFGDTDYIYSFANGSEANHEYRKAVRNSCLRAVLRHEDAYYANGTAQTAVHSFADLDCLPSFLNGGHTALKTLGELLGSVHAHARQGADNRDRETDELRHSLRSVEQHIGWHRGRVVIVSPGHHPTWVDGAKNFLAGVCGDATVQALRSRGTHLRLTTVHQDAVMPYGMRFTADSHVIEQHIWRVRNTTAVHVYMNDDYFVNRDVAITDLFNEYGGTIVRGGGAILRGGEYPGGGGSWKASVLHTQQFNIQELDVRHEDELPADLMEMWETLDRVANSTGALDALPGVKTPTLEEAVEVAHAFHPAALTRTPLLPRRPRHYAAHAPFVYCTNMFRFFETRYEREFAFTALRHRSRKSADFLIPFLYNAFIMARPWQASPQFLPYLLQLHRTRAQTPSGVAPVVNISLDNFDGCAPATTLAGGDAAGCLFAKFLNNLTLNDMIMQRVANSNPLYFNINAGFNTPAAAEQLRKFLHEKFPTPMYLERASDAAATADPEEADGGGEEEGTTTTTTAANAVADAALTTLFDSLMALPVVGVVSHEEGACPLVRSLSLAFAGHHRGRVHVAVQRSNDGAEAETLRETRNRLGHRVVSAIPVPQCAFSSRVVVEASVMAESVADVARRVVAESDGAGVVLPSTCGGGFAGLRVRGFVVDARSPKTPVTSLADLPSVLAMPGQTLALEDFRAVRVGAEDGDVVLVLAREDAAAKAVHWITGASENDLLLTYPLPVRELEDLSASVKWAVA